MTLTFLNPALLWGLLALAVPIIVHFFNLQRPRQVLFSNVAFIREVKKTVVKRVQFQKWLLLLLRLLALTLLVLAFANPRLTKSDQIGLAGNRSVVLVLDNSYSMSASNERGMYFQQAISLARNIIRSYGKQDEFLIMGTSDLRLNYNFADQEESLAELKNLAIEQNIRPHRDLLNFRDDLFNRASNQVHELYFLSDFQTSTVMQDSQQVSLADTNLLIKYIPLATREQKNVYVSENQILTRIIEVNQPVELSMELVNDGDVAVRDLSVRVLVEGRVAAISNVSLESNQSQLLELSFTPNKSGWQSGYIELDDNPISFDNRRYFSLYVPEKEKVLVVENQTSSNVRILYESLFEQFDVSFLSSRNLATVQLSDYRSVVLVGYTDVSSGLSEQLRLFLEEGGSVLFMPGEGLNLARVNAFLEEIQVGNFLPMTRVQEGAKASQVDLAHPIFQGVFSRNQQNREFDAPSVYQYHPFELNNRRIHNRIISLENQYPILVESKVGAGMMFTFTIFPGDTWTDLHVKTIFTPLIFRATQIMNQTQLVQSAQEIGFYLPKSIRTQEKALINLIDAAGTMMTPEQFTQGGATILNFEQMDLVEGNYQLVQNEQLLEHIAFNISDLESQLAFTSQSGLRDNLDNAGLGSIQLIRPEADQLAQAIQTEQEGTPLWKYFIILAICFLLGEILLLKWNRRPPSTT